MSIHYVLCNRFPRAFESAAIWTAVAELVVCFSSLCSRTWWHTMAAFHEPYFQCIRLLQGMMLPWCGDVEHNLKVCVPVLYLPPPICQCSVSSVDMFAAGWWRQAMTGGVDWNDLASPLETSISPIMSLAGRTQIHKGRRRVQLLAVMSYDAKVRKQRVLRCNWTNHEL